MEINQFVAVTNNPEFFLGTTLLYIDTRNTNIKFNKESDERREKAIRQGLSLIEDLI